MVKFSHIADCHLGAFGRNPTLKEYNLQAFERTIEISIDEEVDFIIIAGDLFHNPHPDMDIVDRAVKSLMKARKEGIRIYSVYGSHDFNLSNASLIDVLESADVFKKVVHYLEDEGGLKVIEDPTGVKITGLSGRKNRMDADYYKTVDIPNPDGDSIFVFHTPIAEMKPADIHEEKTVPLSLLPEGYDYYAGGHIHKRITHMEEKRVVYPGPTFGSSYTDLEKEIDRGFYIIDDWELEYKPIEVCTIHREDIVADGLTAEEVEGDLIEKSGKDLVDDVVLLKIKGELSQGMPEDVDFTRIRKRYESNGASTVYLNRRGLEGKTGEKLKIRDEEDEELEERVLNEYHVPEDLNLRFGEDLLRVLKSEQKDGETNQSYEDRIWTECWNIIQERDEYKKRKEKEKDDVGEEEKVKQEEKKSVDEKDKGEGQPSIFDFEGGGS